jgi:hypothetical protein
MMQIDLLKKEMSMRRPGHVITWETRSEHRIFVGHFVALMGEQYYKRFQIVNCFELAEYGIE